MKHSIHKTTGFKIVDGAGQNVPQWRCACGQYWWDDSAGQDEMRNHKLDVLWEERNERRN